MTKHPRIELEPLREIGWAKWDPIGVGGSAAGWPADEYDTYLLQAASQIANGRSSNEVADYLFRVETEYMGLDAVPGIHQRALDAAMAIRQYVETLHK